MNTKVIGYPIVDIVEYKQAGYYVTSSPNYLNYGDDRIVKTTPVYCKKDSGSGKEKFFDLVTDKEYEPRHEYVVWAVQVGTCLQYPDGKKILVTRMIKDRKVATVELAEDGFNPTSMLLRVVK